MTVASAKELLEQAGIFCYVLGGEIGPPYAVVPEYFRPLRKILVGSDREKEALLLLRRFGTGVHGEE